MRGSLRTLATTACVGFACLRPEQRCCASLALSRTASTRGLIVDRDRVARSFRRATVRSADARTNVCSARTAADVVADVDSSSVARSAERSSSSSKGGVSPAARWHARRRVEMLRRHPREVRALESARSLPFALPLLVFVDAALAWLSVRSAVVRWPGSLLASSFCVGSVLSLWQLQLCHEVLHGSMLGAGTRAHRRWRDPLLFWGTLPCAFGYWLYLRHGHLSHHRSLGGHDLRDAFVSDHPRDLADGDVLFVNHRMSMVGKVGPEILGRPVSVGRFAFGLWRRGAAVRNAALFCASFLTERVMLVCNDVVVAATGRNVFFPNKPRAFHRGAARHARTGLAVRVALCVLGGRLAGTGTSLPDVLGRILPFRRLAWSWRPLLFLALSETLWSLPPHPACSMFVTNHGSDTADGDDACVPTGSTYAGRWYSVLTLGTNYHVEHHDFPTAPLHRLGELRGLAGDDFYRTTTTDADGATRPVRDDLGRVMREAFARPDFYACTNAAGLRDDATPSNNDR